MPSYPTTSPADLKQRVLSPFTAGVPERQSEAGEDVSGDVPDGAAEAEADTGAQCVGQRPELESASISSVAKKKHPSDVLHEMPVYSHYGALALHDLLQTCTQQLESGVQEVSASFRGVTYTLPQVRLAMASEAIREAAAQHGAVDVTCTHGMLSTKALQETELAYTAIYAVALDRLVFGEPQYANSGIVAHQGPVRKKARVQGNPEAADLLGIRRVMGVVAETVFVSDIKIGDSVGSTVETALYGKFASLSAGRSAEAVLLLGLAATVDTASLWLYVIAHKEVWGIPLMKSVKPWDTCLLATLCIALRSLAAKPIWYNILVSPQPWLDDSSTYVALKQGAHNRVFRNSCTQEVNKIFDREDSILLPNRHLMEVAGLQTSEGSLSADGRYYVVKYPYIEGSHQPTSPQQFRGVLDILHKLHEQDYVHGDIRPQNIIFHPDGLHSSLIDFDLARKDGTYPPGYYFSGAVRHPDARAGLQMKQVHDLHSLKLILQHYFGDIAKDLKPTYDSISRLVEAPHAHGRATS